MNQQEQIKRLRKLEDYAVLMQTEARALLSQIDTPKPRKTKQVSAAVRNIIDKRDRHFAKQSKVMS